VAKALSYIRSKGMFHCDLRPTSILVKVMDDPELYIVVTMKS
jgi:hypothetical protein